MNSRQVFSIIVIVGLTFADVRLAPSFADNFDCWEKSGTTAVLFCTSIIAINLQGQDFSKIFPAHLYSGKSIVYKKIDHFQKTLADCNCVTGFDPVLDTECMKEIQ